MNSYSISDRHMLWHFSLCERTDIYWSKQSFCQVRIPAWFYFSDMYWNSHPSKHPLRKLLCLQKLTFWMFIHIEQEPALWIVLQHPQKKQCLPRHQLRWVCFSNFLSLEQMLCSFCWLKEKPSWSRLIYGIIFRYKVDSQSNLIRPLNPIFTRSRSSSLMNSPATIHFP